jgi:hypothetical protein
MKIVCHKWLSRVVRADAVMWGDPHEDDEKTRRIFRFTRNRPSGS